MNVHIVSCLQHGERTMDLDGPESMCPECRVVGPEDVNIRELVVADLAGRERVGVATYGSPLTSRTQIDTLQYAYEEALDLAVYLRKELYERDMYGD